jgi:hypothetical protein
VGIIQHDGYNVLYPWLIKSIDFNAEEKRLDIQIDFKRGSTFADPDAGDNEVKELIEAITLQTGV